ncbi:MAG TPA: hypothetical protein VNQ55_09865, partial [Parapedobacter sp.]|nr:hypothetical protein [Parapedobacter sp.]
MINSLLLLEKKLTTWTRLTADGQQDQGSIDEVVGLAGDTSAEFQHNLEQCSNPEMLSLKFNQYHHKAVRLINRHPWSEPIRGALGRLLEELEDGRSNLLDEERLLPKHERDVLRAIVDRDLPAICTAIERRGLPAAYCHEMRCAFRNLFDDTRLPELTYRHRAYVPLLLNQGLTLSA